MTMGVVVAKKHEGRARKGPQMPAGFFRLRASGEFREWLARFAESERSDMSDLVDDALAHYAKARKFEPPPKR